MALDIHEHFALFPEPRHLNYYLLQNLYLEIYLRMVNANFGGQKVQ